MLLLPPLLLHASLFLDDLLPVPFFEYLGLPGRVLLVEHPHIVLLDRPQAVAVRHGEVCLLLLGAVDRAAEIEGVFWQRGYRLSQVR